MPTIAVAPTIPANSVDSTFQSLFTMLGTAEDVLGVPRINRALSAGTYAVSASDAASAYLGQLAPSKLPAKPR